MFWTQQILNLRVEITQALSVVSSELKMICWGTCVCSCIGIVLLRGDLCAKTCVSIVR